jgi:hypothetical protein
LFKELYFKLSLLILVGLGGFSFAYQLNLIPPETIGWLKTTRSDLKTIFNTSKINSLEIIPDSELKVKSRLISCYIPSDSNLVIVSYEELPSGQIITTFTNDHEQNVCFKITFENTVFYAKLSAKKSGSVGYKPTQVDMITIIGR